MWTADGYVLAGCRIEKLTAKEMLRLGLPDSAGEVKRAVLRVPFEFPKLRRRKGT